jgi:rubrerythrin
MKELMMKNLFVVMTLVTGFLIGTLTALRAEEAVGKTTGGTVVAQPTKVSKPAPKVKKSKKVKKGKGEDSKAAVEKTVFTCPMCHIDATKPGKCPMCGMDMVKKEKKSEKKSENEKKS